MNLGLYQSASSLRALERWQDAVTQNVSSGQVTGFKRRTVQFSAALSGELQTSNHVGGGVRRTEESSPGWFPRIGYSVDFAQGEAHPTRRDLDVAIQGEGFFELELPDGRVAYTRAGSFNVSPERQIITPQGYVLRGEGGTPLQLQPEGGPPTIDPDGTIVQGDAPVGRIAIMRFASPESLVPAGNGLFMAAAGVEPEVVEEPIVQQGALEGSNISPMREMIDLVQIARAYESNQKLIQSRDETMRRTLETLG